MDRPIFLDPPTRESFAKFCRTLYERHLVTGVGGNVSARGRDRFLVSPSGISLRDITPDNVVTVESDGSTLKGVTPSSEFSMHRRILEQRKDISIVCHVHGSYIVAASAILDAGPDSLPPLTPGFTFFAYPLPLVPFYVPGSVELSEAVEKYFTDRNLNALLLKNHGLITVGTSMAEAINIAEEVDEAARIFILTDGQGSKIGKGPASKISP